MFSKKQDHGLTTQDFHKVIENLSAQLDLVNLQLQDGSISEKRAQTEIQRLTSLMSSYRQNMESALEEQHRGYSPR